jgi:hypothetical protein
MGIFEGNTMAMNEMDMGEMMPDESMQGMQMENMESEPQQNPVDIIKQDHRKVEGLFEQFESTQDQKQKLEIAKQICLELSVHAEYEEELVYPLLADEDEDTEEEAELEHELIKFMISQLDGVTARDKTLEPKVKVLKELVQHHVEEEESEALPELKDNQELQSRTQQILDRKQELMAQMKSGKSRGGRKSAARSSSGGRKTASTSRSKSGSKRGSSTSAKKSAAGRKGGTSKGKKSASSSSSRKSSSSSSSRSKSSSSRGKSSGGSKSKSSNGSKSSSSKRGAAGNKSLAKKGARKSAAVRSGKKPTGRRAR